MWLVGMPTNQHPSSSLLFDLVGGGLVPTYQPSHESRPCLGGWANHQGMAGWMYVSEVGGWQI